MKSKQTYDAFVSKCMVDILLSFTATAYPFIEFLGSLSHMSTLPTAAYQISVVPSNAARPFVLRLSLILGMSEILGHLP